MRGTTATIKHVELELRDISGQQVTEGTSDQQPRDVPDGSGLGAANPRTLTQRVVTYCSRCERRLKLGIEGTAADCTSFLCLLAGTFGLLCVECRST